VIVHVGKAIIDAFEAHSPEEQTIGLSQTESLADGQGMLFVYPKEQLHSFWMPESMKFPLDIIFVTNDSRVERVASLPLGGKITGRGQWVLEVPAGFCARAGVKQGDKLTLEEEHPDELEASTSSDVLRTLSTASRSGQSTETAPYQRPPSTPSSTPPQERFKNNDMLDMRNLDGGGNVTQGPVHDESWNSPTRAKLGGTRGRNNSDGST